MIYQPTAVFTERVAVDDEAGVLIAELDVHALHGPRSVADKELNPVN